MDHEYYIFEKFAEGSVQWRGAIVGLEGAIVKAEALAKLWANELFILSRDAQGIVYRIDGTKPVAPRADGKRKTA